MTRSLPEELPKIVSDGRQGAERILERRHRVRLQTWEWVLPSRDLINLRTGGGMSGPAPVRAR